MSGFTLPYLVKNGKLLKTTLDSSKFLSESKRGAYTGARTIKLNSGKQIFVFNLSQHVNRLTNSCRIMMKDKYNEIPKIFEKVTNDELLKLEISQYLKQGFSVDETKDDLKLTILITWEDESYELSIHFSKLLENVSENVEKSIELIPGSRTHILAKDSEWVRYRKQIEYLRTCKSSNEIVLVDHEGNANEGLSSNFFVLMNDKIYTANEGIISGTVRTLILEICKQENIEVVFQAPNIKEIDQWQEIFVSSTSRLLLPIEKLYLHKTEKYFDAIFNKKDENEEKIQNEEIEEYTFTTVFSNRISEKVKKSLLEMSEEIKLT